MIAHACLTFSIILIASFLRIENAQATPRENNQCHLGFASIHPVTNVPPPSVIKKSERFVLEGKILDVKILGDAAEKTKALLPDLPDGTYTYVVDTNRELAVIPRSLDPGIQAFPDPLTSRGNFLGSHEGLVRYLEAKANATAEGPFIKTELLSAGELVVRNKRVIAVTNGAGTFHNDLSHLEFGAAELKAAGLPISARTEYLDYSTGILMDPHVKAVTQIRTEIAALRNPKFVVLLSDMRKLMLSIDRGFPNKAEFSTDVIAAAKDTSESSLRFKGVMFLAKWEAPLESEIQSLYSALQSSGEEKIRAWMKSMEEYVAEHGRATSNSTN